MSMRINNRRQQVGPHQLAERGFTMAANTLTEERNGCDIKCQRSRVPLRPLCEGRRHHRYMTVRSKSFPQREKLEVVFQSRLLRTNCHKLILAISLFLLAHLIELCKSHTMQMQMMGPTGHYQQDPSTTSGVQSFSCGKLYYRTFHLDQQRNVLYVGAM